jgi:hypothetical protein
VNLCPITGFARNATLATPARFLCRFSCSSNKALKRQQDWCEGLSTTLKNAGRFMQEKAEICSIGVQKKISLDWVVATAVPHAKRVISVRKKRLPDTR